jgi:hypothetical protein
MSHNETSESDKKIANILNIDLVEESKSEIINTAPQVETRIVAGPTGDSDADYGVVRQNLKKLILTSEIAIEGILNVANEGDSPRAYEVVSDLIKTALDANNRLMDLHKSMKDIKKEDVKAAKGDTVTNNSIFVGNTSDLLKMIKQKKVVLPPQPDAKDDE